MKYQQSVGGERVDTLGFIYSGTPEARKDRLRDAQIAGSVQ